MSTKTRPVHDLVQPHPAPRGGPRRTVGELSRLLMAGTLLLAASLAWAPLAPGLLAQEEAALPQSAAAEADTAETEAEATRTPMMEAVRIEGLPPTIDGDLSDPAWATAPVATDFVQMEPHEGAPATERTEARVLYDDEALYVGFRAYDSSPDSIAAQLTRRDQQSYSDRVHVIVDSYFDRRTAFHFAVNPLGVKFDAYRYDDNREDSGWEAVWDVATQIDSLGWTAEFRIPLSQLRFSGAPLQSWGINFGRDIARRSETVSWAPLSNREPAMVSRSGVLTGIRDLQPRSRIEVLPYSVARVTRAPGSAENPYWDSTDGSMQVGADLRMGVTSNLTLDLTVNPDFGQVEADPGQVNLTAFETFLPERRPFFQEGASIFRFGIGVGDGDGENQSLFYSRRIGRAPQGSVPSSADWADRPDRTRILSAGKLSGKTDSGWSVGMLNALTGSESARAILDGEEVAMEMEPRTNYSVARVQRDFRGGESALGAIGTSTLREGTVAEELELHREAFTGGLDARHRFRDGTMELQAFLLGSRVAGSPEALARTQRSSARYFQRPDADHVDYDPTATSLEGWSGKLEFWKMGGGPWRFATLTHLRSPGFEANDLGFMPRADNVTQVGYVGYLQNEPGDVLRRWGVNTNLWSGWSFGGEHQELAGNVNGQITTNGNRSLFAGVRVAGEGLSPTLLRGGPAFRTERGVGGWVGFNSDARQTVQASVNTNWEIRPASESHTLSVSPNLRWRPSERATLRVGPSFTRRVEDRQWVRRFTVEGSDEYVFGRMEQSTLGLTVRAETALTPNLSVQLYAQPFLSGGSFDDFRRVADPRADAYADRFEPVNATPENGRYRATLPGGSVTFDDPDFRALQFRSNAVVRWEYRPGSTLYVVWAQSRDRMQQEPGGLNLGRGMDDLFSVRPENVLMIKVNYWLNP